ncbi:MAG: hypothetical protein GY941_21570 [Planctomycetes bacterium]|nr:hypothetical protein [Planctomycetota bacterium]
MAKKTTKKKVSKKAKTAAVHANALALSLQHLRADCGLVSAEAADRSGGGGGFPVGKSQPARMEEAGIKFNKNSDPMITWHLIGIGEDNKGKHEFVNINLKEDGKSFPFARADVEAMGLDWGDAIETVIGILTEHPDAESVHIEAAEGLELLIDVWKKQEFTNVAIVGLAETSEEYGMPADSDPADSDPADELDDAITADKISHMSEEELDQLAYDETDIKPETVETYDELRKQLIIALT